MLNVITIYLVLGLGFSLYGLTSSIAEFKQAPIESIVKLVLTVFLYPVTIIYWLLI